VKRDSYLGRIVKDRYRLLREVSSTEDETTFVAEDVLSGRTVGMRIIPYNYNNADAIREAEIMFQNQLDVLCRLEHPGLPQVLEGFTEKLEMFIVTEFFEGQTLEEMIEKKKAISLEEVMTWSFEMLRILDYLHSRYPPVIFRDFKPSNILVRPNGKVQLINFGTARTYKPFKVQDTLIRYSKGYAAPEQYGGKGQTDARADIYAFGVTLHRLLTGHDPASTPFKLPSLDGFRKDLPPYWQDIVSKTTELKVENRYKNVKEIMTALKAASTGAPQAGREEPAAPKEAVAPEPAEAAKKDPKASSLQSIADSYDRERVEKKALVQRILFFLSVLVFVAAGVLFIRMPIAAAVFFIIAAVILFIGGYFLFIRKQPGA
jgi:serine/threonine protein kinase